MSVRDTTRKSQLESLAFEFDLKHPPSKVWRALTDPELLEEWLLPTIDFKLELGASFKFKTQEFPGWDGTVQCQFVEIEAGRKLSYRWVVGDMEIDTVVTFTLEPTEQGTRLSLVQTGFKPENRQAFGGQRYGWKMMGEKLFKVLEGLA
jgi:uncharacterized protein YndB with AHSA1/START domain